MRLSVHLCTNLLAGPTVLSQLTSQPGDSFWDQQVVVRTSARKPGVRAGTRRCLSGGLAGPHRAVEDTGSGKQVSGKPTAQGAGLKGHHGELSTAIHSGEKVIGFFQTLFLVQSPERLLLSREKENASRMTPSVPPFQLGRDWPGPHTGASLQPWAARTGCSAPHPHRLVWATQPPRDTGLHPHLTDATKEAQRPSTTCPRSRGQEPAELEMRLRGRRETASGSCGTKGSAPLETHTWGSAL